ncbi:caspase-7-like [Dreissena polymorpha]|nr:caspase-7-like [Dreissena polymorpha]
MIANLGKAKQTLKTEKDIYCFVCAILGNGHKGIIDLTEGEYKIEEIRKTFNNDLDSPYFTGRPKVFLIQAGQGYNLQKSSIKFVDSEIAVHVDADALIAYASTPDYAAFESDKGSYFIQTCVEVFKSKHSSCHLEEMMVIVKEQMSCYRFRLKEPLQQADVRDVRDKKHPYYGTFTQMPCVWTTLTRFLYFKSPD